MCDTSSSKHNLTTVSYKLQDSGVTNVTIDNRHGVVPLLVFKQQQKKGRKNSTTLQYSV